MSYLLDTHTLIWALLDPVKLSAKAHKLMLDPQQQLFVSPISFWEIALKTKNKIFTFTNVELAQLPSYTRKLGIEIMPLSAEDAITSPQLPWQQEHKDPFDRLLIWQAIRQNLVLISKDQAFKDYVQAGLRLFW